MAARMHARTHLRTGGPVGLAGALGAPLSTTPPPLLRGALVGGCSPPSSLSCARSCACTLTAAHMCRTHACTHACAGIHKCACMDAHAHMHTHANVRTHARMHAQTDGRTHAPACPPANTHTNTSTRTRTIIRTHTRRKSHFCFLVRWDRRCPLQAAPSRLQRP